MDKQQVIKDFQISKQDTGSAQVQVALLSDKIKELTQHMLVHPKDLASRRGLLLALSQRKKLLKYVARTSPEKNEELVKKLGMRVKK